ncbi:tetratricopeptide repeat protein 28-like [Hydractinia symbiolongicarpus]|uniref:tetratricopeptide repeat protein 28-like n=1 Tax=Hydractinia symbiolongicarpus TaxID=13093 RepID=UPI00254D8A5C|nr:tetratricopeptide repeat protein 28-like [Hydractinia symbiolongicarpus]
MPGVFKKVLDEVTMMLYEKVDNNPDDYRFTKEEPDEIKRKLKYVDMHMKKALEFNLQKEVLDCINHQALAAYKLNDMVKFEELSNTMLEMAVELKDDMRIRQAYCNLGVLCKMNGKFGKALEYYNLALDMVKKRNERWCIARLYNNIANIYEMLNDLEKAMEYQLLRLEVAEELNDLDGITKASSSLAAMYHVSDDVEKSIEYYQKVQDVLRKKLKNFDTLADDAAGSDDDFVDFGEGDEEEQEGEEGGGGGGGGKKKKRCVIL